MGLSPGTTEPSPSEEAAETSECCPHQHSMTGLLNKLTRDVPFLLPKEPGLAKVESREALKMACSTDCVAVVATRSAPFASDLSV